MTDTAPDTAPDVAPHALDAFIARWQKAGGTELAHDGSTAPRFIDLYHRGAFICEAKRVKAGEHTREFGQRILGAYNQALTYVRSLPASEGRPPFVLVVDVGNFIEVFAEFSRSGGHYTQFPDARSCRIRVADLRLPEVRDRLRRIWLDPLSLDPAKQSARVNRDIAARFTGKGPWKKRLPTLLDMLVAVGRARATDDGYLPG